MKLYFCTLFDSNYLTRGLAMYKSLIKHCPDFHLYIFAFDDKAVSVLQKLMLKNATVISLKEFEGEELLKIKPTRSAAEYCWTCTPSSILYSIEKYNLTHCTYIDADLLFYSNPEVLISEMGNKSVLITDHRYTPAYDQTKTSGKYCVQFMCFKNDEKGMRVLKWWRNACNEWCYARVEEGKFGDQKYLDDWTARFEGVHELAHIGGGVAPWNMQQYQFKIKNDVVFLKETSSEYVPLVFFHFHGLKFYIENLVLLCPHSYELSDFIKTKLYYPYVIILQEQKRKITSIDSSFDPNAAINLEHKPYTIKDKLHLYKQAFLSFNTENIKRTHKDVMAQKKLNFTKLTDIL